MSKVEQNKKRLLSAMEKYNGIVSAACKAAKISRTTYYGYINKDPEFKKQIDDIENIALDYVESKLFKLIEELNPASILFYLKCKGKKRGYIEKQEIEHSGKVDNGGVNINVMKDSDVKEVQKLINGN